MGVQGALDGVLQGGDDRRDLAGEAGALEQADAVLARDRAAEVEGVADDVLEGRLRSRGGRGVVGRDDQQGVQVAVTGVRDVGDEHAVPLPRRDDAVQHLGHGTHRDAHVLGEHRAEALQGRVGEPSGGEQRLRLVVVGGQGREGRARSLHRRQDRGGLVVARGAGGVDAGQQQGTRVDREAHVLPPVHGLQAVPVHQLEGRGYDAARADRRHGAAGRRDVLELARDGALGGTGRTQPQGDLGDDAERPLGADHEAAQVQAGDPLGGSAPEADDLARAGHHLEPEHVVTRHAVLDAAHAPGVGGDVAPDRRPRGAGRVRRVPQAVARRLGPQVVVDHAGLDDGQALALVDLTDRGHRLEGHDHRSGRGVGPTRQAGPGSARHHRHRVVAAPADQRGDLVGAPGPHDGQRRR